MDLFEAKTEGARLLAAHGLSHWRLEFDQHKRRLGCCRFRHQTISLSAPYILINGPQEMADTVLHEIAHALAGPHAGHGPEWKAVCNRIGARAERCVSEGTVVAPPAAWVGTCSGGHTVTRHRLSHRARRMSCGECSPRAWSEAALFTWQRKS